MRLSVDFVLSHMQIMSLTEVLRDSLAPGFLQSSVIDVINGEGEVLEENEKYKVFGIGTETAEKIQKNADQLKIIQKGTDKLSPSMFIGMIASFDTLIVDAVGRLIKINPDRHVSPDLSVSFSDILNAKDISEVIRNFVADELYRFSRESHDAQTAYIEKKFSISIRDKWKRWPDFIEVFERRNLAAHGEPKFNERYADICKKAGHKGSDKTIGSEIELGFPYLCQALRVLGEYAIMLPFVLWRKHVPSKENEAFQALNEAAYKLIQNSHHLLAERILEFALSIKNAEMEDRLRKMMVVNHASAAKTSVSAERCTEILAAEDWSASSIEFRVSVAALREDVSEVIRLLPQLKNGGFEVSNFRFWPVFRFIRDDEDLNSATLATYNERISDSTSSEVGEVSVDKQEDKPALIEATKH